MAQPLLPARFVAVIWISLPAGRVNADDVVPTRSCYPSWDAVNIWYVYTAGHEIPVRSLRLAPRARSRAAPHGPVMGYVVAAHGLP